MPATGHVGPRSGSIERDFWEFHQRNPHVYVRLVELAREARAAGARKLGIAQLFEVLRWTHSVATRDWSDFKLNNNYRSYYARLIMQREPELDGIFETRQLHAAEPFDGRLFSEAA